MSTRSEFYGCPYDNEGDGRSVTCEQDLRALIEIMKPKASAAKLIRIGGDQDGAYLLPDDMDGIEACFSPGVNSYKHFEDVLTNKYSIKCHMCDYSCSEDSLATPLIPRFQTFRKKWLDVDGGSDSISLDGWVAELAPNRNHDLILQIDIEGAEYRNLLACSNDTLARFRIIVIELHGLGESLNNAVFSSILYPFFKKIDEHFKCVHHHPNNCCGDFVVPNTGINIPNVTELTFMRKDRFARREANGWYAPMLPHPLDITRNVKNFPPIVLNESWLDGGRSLPSQIKLLEEQLAYQIDRNAFVVSAQKRLEATLRAFAKQYGSEDVDVGDATQLHEVAAGRPYTTSSGVPLSGTVPDTISNYFFHTDFGDNEYIRIDLGEIRKVRAVTITNRRDAAFDRASTLFIAAETGEEGVSPLIFIARTDDNFALGESADSQTWLPPTPARYITVRSPVRTALHFARIQVHAE